jgi:RHS repeat-associated protein
MTEPAGSWSYGYDNDSRLTSQTNPASETTTWTFDADSRTAGQTFANGQVDVYGYDTRGRKTSLTHENSSGGTISAESYTWDAAGNLTAKTVDSNSWSYGYDADDQLLTETAPTYSAAYTYDANGNRASYTIGGVTQTYNVDSGDKLNSITSGGTTLKSYTYDAAGRTTSVTTSAGTTNLSYDYEDRVTGITFPGGGSNSYAYNGLDTRTGKTDSTGTYSFVRDGADVTDPVLDDGAANYTPGVSQHRSGATTFENVDYLGTSTRQTNASQSTTATRSHDAFGNLVATTGTPIGPFGFAGDKGYQEDPDSGLKLLGHRYYDPSTGRFLTRDPAKDGRNWYAYCNSSPLTWTDCDGLQIVKIKVRPLPSAPVRGGGGVHITIGGVTIDLPPGTTINVGGNGTIIAVLPGGRRIRITPV